MQTETSGIAPFGDSDEEIRCCAAFRSNIVGAVVLVVEGDRREGRGMHPGLSPRLVDQKGLVEAELDRFGRTLLLVGRGVNEQAAGLERPGERAEEAGNRILVEMRERL